MSGDPSVSSSRKSPKQNPSNGFGPLQKLLDDETISEIMVNGPKAVFVERQGEIQRTEVHFNSDQEIIALIDEVARSYGRKVTFDEPSIDTRLPDGSRFNAIIPPIAIDGPSITIRKFPKTRWGMEKLIEIGSITPNMAAFLDACVKARMNLIISGGVSSGKTTMLNVLSSYIPTSERIVTIEDAAELQLQFDHVVRLEGRPAEVGKSNEISIRSLVRNALRMRPDRIIVGEVRGPEAFDMLQAMNTGLPGSLATVHANSPRDAIARLENLVLLAGVDLPVISVRQQIASAVDVIVQLNRFTDGTRKVTSIIEVTGMEGDVVTTGDLFEFVQAGTTQVGKVQGEFRGLGIPPMLMPRLKAAGVDPGFEIFQKRN